jgi:hypothetical protein
MCLKYDEILRTREIMDKVYANHSLDEKEIEELKSVGLDYNKLKEVGKLYTMKENVSS